MLAELFETFRHIAEQHAMMLNCRKTYDYCRVVTDGEVNPSYLPSSYTVFPSDDDPPLVGTLSWTLGSSGWSASVGSPDSLMGQMGTRLFVSNADGVFLRVTGDAPGWNIVVNDYRYNGHRAYFPLAPVSQDVIVPR